MPDFLTEGLDLAFLGKVLNNVTEDPILPEKCQAVLSGRP